MSIILENLTKRFGILNVVQNISFEITDGQLFVLLGESGSGKSTILRMIAGLIQPDSGCIHLNGKDVTYLPPQKRGTGFVFQDYSIFKHMTISENVGFGLRIRGLPPGERKERTEELLDLVGLSGLGGRYSSQLSGGQRQRVALARALAYKPAVLLLDEPFGALDVRIRSQLRRNLKEIQQQLSVTTILVTHDQDEAFELADQIGIIDHGRLIEIGSPEKLYQQPENEFTATFIGGGNVLAGRKKDKQIRLGDALLPYPENAPHHEEDTPVRILFRPETVVIQHTPFRSDQPVYPLGQGKIIEQSFAGAMQKLVVAVDNLRGVRPLVPRMVYGQANANINVHITTQGDTAEIYKTHQTAWIGLRNYHVLQPSGLKILVIMDRGSAGEQAAHTGARLAQAAHGSLTYITHSKTTEETTELRTYLDALTNTWRDKIPLIESRVREGSIHDLAYEVMEEDYELVVVGQDVNSNSYRQQAHIRDILFQWGIPVLIVRCSRDSFDRLLICTGAGEPGKSDVRFGARIARLFNASAGIMHVHNSETGAGYLQRVTRHLAYAKGYLETLGIKAEGKIVEGPVVGTILHEVIVGKYNLIVMGAPAPLQPGQIFSTDLVRAIIDQTEQSVLVVPMQE